MSVADLEMTAAAFAVDTVTKRYGLSQVLSDVSLEIGVGTCVALLGENGAGKSTLVKVLSGLITPTSGTLRIAGRPVRFGSPRDAQLHGIATIPQELAYVPALTVAENLLIGRWPSRSALTSGRQIRRRAAQILEGLRLDLDPDATMLTLTLAQRQLVEVAKALSVDARLVILDEPTASLNDLEAERLLQMLTAMKAQGVALLYVSHRLAECFRLADELLVLRNGQVVARNAPDGTTPAAVVGAMLGKEYTVPQRTARAELSSERPLVRLSDWRRDRVPRLNGVDLELRRGEVHAVFGLVGSGAETVARGLGGHPGSHIRGNLELDGRSMTPFSSPGAARRAGVGYVPAERKTDGLALGRPLREALTVLVTGSVSRAGIVAGRRERHLADTLVDEFGIRCSSVRQSVGELSGGNQQKVLLASRLVARPGLLVLHEPTRGVDVAARSQIHELILSAAAAGAAVVVVTSDVDEAVAVADRVSVMQDGVVVRELSGQAMSAAAVLLAATSAGTDPLDERSTR